MDSPVNSPCSPAGDARHHKGRPSSYWMHDPAIIFRELALKRGDVFLDLGCGTGDYSLRAAEEVGEGGIVYAVDIRKELLDNLAKRALKTGFGNIRVIATNLREPLPFQEAGIDVCLISTVLHVPGVWSACNSLFPELRRVMKPGGRLVVIECKKEAMSFGPPLSMRISPDELEGCITAYGFTKTGFVDLGYNYMMKFRI